MTWTLLHERMAFMAQLIQVTETDPEGAPALADFAAAEPGDRQTVA
jgi:hypothetical protein